METIWRAVSPRNRLFSHEEHEKREGHEESEGA
jgi:hypothetical protein